MSASLPNRLVKCAISLFVAANLATVLFVNQPEAFVDGVNRQVEGISTQAGYRWQPPHVFVERSVRSIGI